jgi:multidrug efflux system membrane fusion protein
MFTYVVKSDSTVEARQLKVGDESAALTVITDGLKDGEEVVISNQYRLQPGARIRSTAPAAAAKSAAATPKADS